MKALIALLLLAVGAGSVWAYGMMGGGFGRFAANGGSQDFWSSMASMHNWMHGTNYTTDQFRQDWNGTVSGSGVGGMMGGHGGMMGGDDDGPASGSFGCR